MPWGTGPVTLASVIVPVMVPDVAGRTDRLVAAAAQEYHDAPRDFRRCKMQVGHDKRR